MRAVLTRATSYLRPSSGTSSPLLQNLISVETAPLGSRLIDAGQQPTQTGSIAFFAKGFACSSVCRLSFGSDTPNKPTEAVAATVLTAVSLVPRQVVFVERVDGCRSANFRTAIVFQLSMPTSQAKASSGSLFRRCKKNGDVQSLRSHRASRDPIARHNSTGSRSVPLRIKRPLLAGVKATLRRRVPNTGKSRQSKGESHATAFDAAGRVFERSRAGE
jgi:hypothetical protein